MLLTLAWGVNWPILKIASTCLPLFPFRAICVLGVGISFAHWLCIKVLQLEPAWVASLSVLTVPCVGLISGAVVLC